MAWFRFANQSKTLDGHSGLDARLVERLKLRDEHAFLDLYDRYHRSVYRFLVHMSGSIALAEELTQEVFVVILDSLDNSKFNRFDPEKGTLEGYLLGIARNLARKEAKRNFRLVPLEDILERFKEKQLLQHFSHDEQVLDDLLRHSELGRLHVAIQNLPSHYREVIVLCCLQEKSYYDAAEILGCSEGTIASRMSRAKSLLAGYLKAPIRDGKANRSLKGGAWDERSTSKSERV